MSEYETNEHGQKCRKARCNRCCKIVLKRHGQPWTTRLGGTVCSVPRFKPHPNAVHSASQEQLDAMIKTQEAMGFDVQGHEPLDFMDTRIHRFWDWLRFKLEAFV